MTNKECNRLRRLLKQRPLDDKEIGEFYRLMKLVGREIDPETA